MKKTAPKTSYQYPAGGYGKRPMWQWLAIYAVVGLVIYGLVYYFVFAQKGDMYKYGASVENSSVIS